ncbi:hypothetical protein EV174_001232 [Coemansia sp. RSA 2320]|nr:hypothetical protein EV174_001232 [Coemansia sp. RSA 2320]
MRLRMAKAKYRQLVAELSECKGILNYIDSEEMVQAQAVATEAQEIMARADGELADEELARVESIHCQLMLTGEELVRLMEKIDGVAPALVLDAAQLEPWAEHDAELKSKYERRGLGAAFELAGDVRAIRKGMIRKAERRAQIIDRLKRATLRLVENSKPKSLVPDAP